MHIASLGIPPTASHPTSLDLSLRAAVLRVLSKDAAIVSVGLPGGPFSWMVPALRPDLQTLTLVPASCIRQLPGLASNLADIGASGSSANLVSGIVSNDDFWLTATDQYPLGALSIPASRFNLQCRSLGRFLDQLRHPGLLTLGAFDGAGVLLVPLLEALADQHMLVLVDQTQAGNLTQILHALPSDRFHAWVLEDGQRLIRVTDGAMPNPTDAATLLLAPARAWQVLGLDRLAAAQTQAERDAALALAPLVPVSAGLQPATLDLLAHLGPAPAPFRHRDKITLLCGTGLLVPHARPEMHEDIMHLRTGRPGELDLIFTPPAPGLFRYGLILKERPPEDLLHDLFDVTFGSPESMRWSGDWYQFLSERTLTAGGIQRPMTIRLRRQLGGWDASIALLIRGIELDYGENRVLQ